MSALSKNTKADKKDAKADKADAMVDAKVGKGESKVDVKDKKADKKADAKPEASKVHNPVEPKADKVDKFSAPTKEFSAGAPAPASTAHFSTTAPVHIPAKPTADAYPPTPYPEGYGAPSKDVSGKMPALQASSAKPASAPVGSQTTPRTPEQLEEMYLKVEAMGCHIKPADQLVLTNDLMAGCIAHLAKIQFDKHCSTTGYPTDASDCVKIITPMVNSITNDEFALKNLDWLDKAQVKRAAVDLCSAAYASCASAAQSSLDSPYAAKDKPKDAPIKGVKGSKNVPTVAPTK